MPLIVSRTNDDEPAKAAFEHELAELAASRTRADVLLVPPIYHLAEDDRLWETLAALGGPVVAATWLYPRPAEWVLRKHDVGGHGLRVLCMDDYESAEACLDACDLGPEQGEVRELVAEIEARWYPVIDRSRCVNCQQCFQFCLFGVFEVDEDGAVLPVRPDNCKDGCPACGRVCPRGAIMFPLYTRDLAIAGAPGTRAKPDEAAKQMFEQRTNRPHADPNDDLDDLIDDLEQLMESD